MSIFKRLEQTKNYSPITNQDAINITKFKSTPFSSLYDDEEESGLFDIVKSARKERNYSPIPLKENQPKTYWNLVINKPKPFSPAAEIMEKEEKKKTDITMKDFISQWLGRTINRQEEEWASLLETLVWKISWRATPQPEVSKIVQDFFPSLNQEAQKEIALWTWKATSQKAASTFMWVLESIEKPVNKLAYYNAEFNRENKTLMREVVKELSEDWLLWNLKEILHLDKKSVQFWADVAVRSLTRSLWGGSVKDSMIAKATTQYLKERKEWPSDEEASINNKLFWWVQHWLSFNLNSLEENRRQVVSWLSWPAKEQAEQFLEDNRNEILAKDVVLGVASGVLTGWAISSTIKNLNKASKGYRILKTFDETVNPTLTNMAKVGWILAANAALYYWVTGEYVYWGDKQAEEGALASALVLTLKWIWLTPSLAKWGTKYIKDVLNNPKVQEWMASFFEAYAKKTWAIANIVDDWWKALPSPITKKTITPEVRKDIWNRWTRLKAIQDSADEFSDPKMKYTFLEEKKILLKSFIDDWLARVDWIDSKWVRFVFNDEYGKIIFWKRYKPSKRIINHLPEEFAKDIVDTSLLKPNVVVKNGDNAIKFINAEDVKKPKTIEEKIRREWFWDETKSRAKNIVNYYTNKMYSQYAETRPKQIAELFWKYKNEILKNLKKTKSYGRISDVNKRISDIYKNIKWNEQDFNKYLWAKSRLQKSINYQIETWEELLTKAQGTILNRADLEDIVKFYEGWANWGRFTENATEVYRINRELLNFEMEAWIRSADEINNFLKTNPYYVKDKLVQEVTENIQKSGRASGLGWPKTKALKWGSEEIDFDTDVLSTLYSDYASRIHWANKNLSKNLWLSLAEDMWDSNINVLIRRLKKWEAFKAKEGEVEGVVRVDWEDVRVAINKQWNDFLETTTTSWQEWYMKALRFPTTVTKTLATWVLAPVHSISMLIPEIINAATYAKANWIPLNQYLWALFNSMGRKVLPKNSKSSFVRNPELKKAMEQLAKLTGADFSFYRAMQQELAEAWWRVNPVLKKPKNKIHEIAINIGDFWHNMEMSSIRIPVIEAWLKEAWLTLKQFQSAIQEASQLWVGIDVVLRKKWIDVDKIWWIARDIFNYADASISLKNLGRVLPYANIAAVTTEMMKRLISENPKAAMWIIWTYAAMSQIIYEFNYYWEKGDKLRQQDTHLSHQSWFMLSDGWEWEAPFLRLRNIPQLEWIYPLVVEMNESVLSRWWEDRKFSVVDSFNKIIKDITYAIEIDREWLAMVQNITPNWLKQWLEVMANKDFFFDSPLVSDFNKRPWYELLETNDRVREGYNKFAYWLAYATWWRENEKWIMEWWYQVSPIKLQKLFSPIDPFNYRTGKITSDLLTLWKAEFEAILSWEEMSEKDAVKLKNLFIKTYKLKDWTDDVFKWQQENKDVVWEHIKSVLRSSILNDDKETYIETIEKYLEEDDWKYAKYIKDKLKERSIKDKWWWEIMRVSWMSSADIAQWLTDMGEEKWMEALPKIFDSVSENKRKLIVKQITGK